MFTKYRDSDGTNEKVTN